MEGSAQCRSSHTARTGCRSASSSSQAARASCVFCRCRCGRQLQWRIPLRQRHGEQGGKERHDFLQGQAIRPQHLLEPVELRLQGHRHAAIGGTAAGAQSPDTGHCCDDRENSETPCAWRPRGSPARAGPPPGAIYQCPPRRGAAPPGPCRPDCAPSAPASSVTSDSRPTRGVRPVAPAMSSDSAPHFPPECDTPASPLSRL